MSQPNLFDKRQKRAAVADEQVVLYALGDFQARGLVLAERDLPLDRLRGALRRASLAFGVEEFSDEHAVHLFQALGATVSRRHAFAAKHPFHIIVPAALAERARVAYDEMTAPR